MKMKIKIKIKDDHVLQFVKGEKLDKKDDDTLQWVEVDEKDVPPLKGHSLEKETESERAKVNSGSWYITRGNPTCYFNLDLGDGTTLQIPYPC